MFHFIPVAEEAVLTASENRRRSERNEPPISENVVDGTNPIQPVCGSIRLGIKRNSFLKKQSQLWSCSFEISAPLVSEWAKRTHLRLAGCQERCAERSQFRLGTFGDSQLAAAAGMAAPLLSGYTEDEAGLVEVLCFVYKQRCDREVLSFGARQGWMRELRESDDTEGEGGASRGVSSARTKHSPGSFTTTACRAYGAEQVDDSHNDRLEPVSEWDIRPEFHASQIGVSGQLRGHWRAGINLSFVRVDDTLGATRKASKKRVSGEAAGIAHENGWYYHKSRCRRFH